MLGTHSKPRIFVTAALALLATAPARSADWRLTAARPTRFGASLSFLDIQSIRGGNGQVQFSTLTFFGRSTRGMNRVSAAITADCRTMVYRFDQITLFRNQQPLSQWHSAGSAPAAPGSNLYDAMSAACGSSDTGAHVDRIEAFAAGYFRQRPSRRGA